MPQRHEIGSFNEFAELNSFSKRSKKLMTHRHRSHHELKTINDFSLICLIISSLFVNTFQLFHEAFHFHSTKKMRFDSDPVTLKCWNLFFLCVARGEIFRPITEGKKKKVEKRSQP